MSSNQYELEILLYSGFLHIRAIFQETESLNKEFRFRIISESMTSGVSATCRKYSISRTIYYRWLKRYKAEGVDGLEDVKRNFIPFNKTSQEIETALLELVKIYPSYGPKSLNYLLEELGFNLSSSAVFNILKRHDLTNKYRRFKYTGNGNVQRTDMLPAFSELRSGEGWVFWTIDCGSLNNGKTIYSYTLMDMKSRIACTRLYTDISLSHFEDVLEAVAFSVAATLNLKSSYLCFFKDDRIVQKYRKSYRSRISESIKAHDKEMKLQLLDSYRDIRQINDIKEVHTSRIISHILPLLQDKSSIGEIKKSMQQFVRDYNLKSKIPFDKGFYTPVEYHNKQTNTKLILPVWAYIDRDY